MRYTTFTTPPGDRYLEDYAVGATYQLGGFTFSESEIIEFARRFDPQPFHIDPAAARDSAFGGLIASGWHTGSAMMRAVVDGFISTVAGLGSPGMDEVRWLKPVRPGDRLTVRVTVEAARRSVSKPDRGVLHSLMEVVGEDGTPVMTARAIGLVRCRER